MKNALICFSVLLMGCIQPPDHQMVQAVAENCSKLNKEVFVNFSTSSARIECKTP